MRMCVRLLYQAIQAHAGPLMDALLNSPAPDEENAEAVTRILDSCEEQYKGAGATLALGYLDTVWWLPAPIRPEIGALALLAVYEALRRFGVFTRCRFVIALCAFRFVSFRIGFCDLSSSMSGGSSGTCVSM